MQNDPSPKLLVVDDHRPTVEMLQRLFTRQGYDVFIAFDGEKAIEQAVQCNPDVILLDIMMPGMSGFEVLEVIRNHDSLNSIPVLLVTAKDNPKDVEAGLLGGADDYVLKPFEPRELIARVANKVKEHELLKVLYRRTQDLEALLYVSEKLNRHMQTSELLRVIVNLIDELLPTEFVLVCRLNEQQGLIDYQVIVEGKSAQPPNVNVSQIAMSASQYSQHPLWHGSGPTSLLPEYQQSIVAHLQHGQQLHGVIVIGSNTKLDDYYLRLFEAIARQVTLSLRNAELYEIKVNYANHLEEMVEERARELRSAQELLVRSEKMASIGRLASGIAHEINNPLLPILLNLEHMVEDLQQGVSIKYHDIEDTLDSAKRIRRIVDRLLQFSRKRLPDKTSHLNEIEIVHIINTVVELSRNLLETSEIKVDFNTIRNGTEIPKVYGDQDQLEQVILNLVLNACDAMPNGGILSINLYSEESWVVIEVIDNGTGIDPKAMNHIFEPFESTKENGTGLGLFISYQIIQNHHGILDVKSELGIGTTVTIKLPNY